MSAAAPVRCPECGLVVFAIVHGIAEGKCHVRVGGCGRRITAERKLHDKAARILNVDRVPERQLVESK